MNLRKSLIVSLAFAGVIASGASHAQNAVADPESGLVYSNVLPTTTKSTVSRADVVAGIVEFQANPVSADGRYRFTAGESGWELVSASYGVVGGKVVRTDKLDRSAPAPMVNAEDFYRQLLIQESTNPSNG